ncbi:MAG: DUF2116 family Zn-ribbon domain-containing protein [archaeon]
MHKICVRCGVIYEVKEDQRYCSDKCKRLFEQSSLSLIKKATPDRKTYAP